MGEVTQLARARRRIKVSALAMVDSSQPPEPAPPIKRPPEPIPEPIRDPEPKPDKPIDLHRPGRLSQCPSQDRA